MSIVDRVVDDVFAGKRRPLQKVRFTTIYEDWQDPGAVFNTLKDVHTITYVE